MANETKRLFEFGSYRFDTQERALRCEGVSISLTPKCADLLLALLEQHGQLVHKEDLIKKVWQDTFVEDGSLTFHIHLVREALRDGVDGQRYIETVPKRGYRFIAPVKEVALQPDAATLASSKSPQSVSSESIHPVLRTAVGERPRTRLSRRTWILALVLASAVVLTLLVVVAASRWKPSPPRVFSYTPLTKDGCDKFGSTILTDGLRVYFEERCRGGFVAAAVAIEGGQPVPLPQTLRGFSLADISPQRSQLLAYQHGSNSLWITPVAGGSPRRVGEVIADSAGWSPDGERIVYAHEKSLYIAKIDGSDSRKLLSLNDYPGWPRWSPDGKILRFTVITRKGDDVTESLWEVGADGANPHPILPGWNHPPRECCGNWTANGKYFVFQSIRNGRADLWALREKSGLFAKASGSPMQLTAGPISFYSPTSSRDGRKIFAVGTDKHGELVRYEPNLKTFVPYLGGISASWASSSRDGNWVAYVTYPEKVLWLAKSDGSQKVQLTFAPFEVESFLAWSPDGKWIALRGRKPGTPWKIHVISAEGGEPKPLTTRQVEEGFATWSADGLKIAFGDVPTAFGRANGAEVIHIYDLTSHQISALPGSEGLWTSRWSPNGRFMAALTISGQRLMLFDFATKKWRATSAQHVNNPTWSQDGKYIYFDTEGDNHAIRRMRVSDGKLELLVDLNGYPTVGFWAGLTPNNSPLVLRNLGVSEIYVLDVEFP